MKKISPATVTFGVMAIVLGLVAAYIVRQALRKPEVAKPPAPPPPAAPALGELVLARHNIPKNTLISASDLIVVKVASSHPALDPKKENDPRGPAIRSAENGAGRIANMNIHAGLLVREGYMLKIGETLPDLAERIPEGMRALTINVQGATTGGKPLAEGDYVDIAMTIEGTHPDIGEVQTRTLMRNVKIVDAAAGEPLTRNGTMGRTGYTRPVAFNTSNITVAVTEKDANKLIVAQRTGTLSVTLCSRKGSSDESDTTADRERLLNLTKLPEPPPPPPPPKPKDPPPPPRVYRMEVYQGGGKSIREFNEDQIDEAERNTQYVKPGPVVEPTSKETEPETTRTTVRKKPSPFARAAGAN